MAPDLNRQLALKGYVYFNATDEGVFFQAREGSFILKGKSLYPLVSRIINLLDAGHTPGHILEELPPKFRPVFQELLKQLGRYDMLLDRQLFAEIKRQYGEFSSLSQLLDYLQDRLGDFRPRFERWRGARVCVIGEGYALKAAVDALAGSGLRTLSVVLHRRRQTVPAPSEIRRLLDQASAEIPEFDYELLETRQPVPDRPLDFDYLLYAYENLNAGLIPETDAPPLLVAGVVDGVGLVSPQTHSGATDYFDARGWLRAGDQGSEIYSPVALALLGSVAAFNLLRYFFGIDTELLDNYVTRISPHLDISRHPLLPLTVFSRGNDVEQWTFEQDLEVPDDREIQFYEDLLIRLAPLFDPVFGPFNQEEAKELSQVPLIHDALEVRVPNGSKRQSEHLVSWGFDVSDAGLRVIKHGLSILAAVSDPSCRRTLVTEFEHGEWLNQATAVALAESSGFRREARAAVIAVSGIEDQDVRLLDEILRVHLGTGFCVELHWWPGRPVYVARVIRVGSSGRVVLPCAVGATPLTVIKEGMGNACCGLRFQGCRVAGDASDWLKLPPAETIDTDGRLLCELLQVSVEPAGSRGRLLHFPLAGDRVFSGYAELESAADGADDRGG